mmetsp:Transcript_17479/g.25515  ORF Transcript_17479/g.25515 Transcript_17479/m.25515 type:complete len:364 (-) Transcript_17479:959-2050(-)
MKAQQCNATPLITTLKHPVVEAWLFPSCIRQYQRKNKKLQLTATTGKSVLCSPSAKTKSSLGLIFDALNPGPDCRLISQVGTRKRPNGVRVLDGVEAGIQVINQGHAGRDVQTSDLLLRDVVQLLDQSPQRVAVSGDDHPLATPDGRCNGLVPVHPEPSLGELEGLGHGDLCVGQPLVPPVMTWPVLARFGEGRRGDVVASAPDVHLVDSMLVHGLLLVEALQGPVVALVQAPVLGDGDPHQVQPPQHRHAGFDGSLQDRGVGEVELEPALLEQSPGLLGLLHALLGQGHVVPPREAVLLVPLALPVPDQHQLVGRLGPTQGVARRLGASDDIGEFWLERSTTNQEPVNIRALDQGPAVLAIH